MKFSFFVGSIALLFLSQANGHIPELYQSIATQYDISADKLYQTSLSRSQYVNASKQKVVWPWVVQVNGRTYQFKTRQELFQYLVARRGQQGIVFGLNQKPLRIVSRKELWQALEVPTMLSSIAMQIKRETAIKKETLLAKNIPTNKPLFTENPRTKLSKQQIFSKVQQWHPLIERVSRETGVDANLLIAMMTQESGGQPKARSAKGALGLMQLMPRTAKELGLTPTQILDPYHNLHGGARYIREQLLAFGRLDLALAAYNAGPNAVRKYGGIPPYKETQNYVRSIQARYVKLQPQFAKVSNNKGSIK